MYRPNRVLQVLALAASLLPQAARADAVAAYLERQGLRELLAVHLEDRLEGLTGQEREDLVLRLVGIYAELLETADDPVSRTNLEERSRRLLASAPPSSGVELRLALMRGSYRAAEKIAESHRLRLSDDESVSRAKETLSEVIPKLRQLCDRIEDRVSVAERRLMRTGGREAAVLVERAESAQRLYSQCMFINAWALYYQSWLHERPDNARVAEELFAQLLAPDSTRLQPEEVSVDLRSVEAVARSILGMALCKSLTSSSATALRWIELLGHDEAHPAVRAQVPAWTIAIHLEHGEYRAAQTILTELSDGGRAPPLAWVRLAAVHALEAEGRNQAAGELARRAVTMLAARGELEQVLDVAKRYGVHALGDAGFAFRYVKGVQHYHGARERHGSDSPSADKRLLDLYQQAVDEFEQALAETDADRYPEAAASCRWLIGWCRFFQGRFLAARDAFERAAGRLGPDEAPEALWMAVVSLDKVVQADRNDALREALSELIDRALALYPDSPRAPKLILKRALDGDRVSDEVVSELLAIRPESAIYDEARQRAAQVLYLLYRRSSGDQRLAYGNEYLAVAVPLLGAVEKSRDPLEPGALETYLARSRRVLEVAFTRGIDRPATAANVLDALNELRQQEGLDLSAHEDEIDYRRLQQRLSAGDTTAAAAIADSLWARDRASVWSRLAERALFARGLERWRAGDSARSADRADLELVVRHGRRILAAFADHGDALRRQGVLACHAAVAEALAILSESSGDLAQAREALRLYEALLSVRPGDAGSLRATAALAERLGNLDRALECWRTLVAGSGVGTPRWYEAKFHLISLLAELDPARARSVIDQHRRLNPAYGPEPWRSRFEALDLRIPRPEGNGDTSTPVPEGKRP
ncbi:MAG: tetratricopeptide repeat protein [Planctomycetota bacterium]|jgi:hypothetical protein